MWVIVSVPVVIGEDATQITNETLVFLPVKYFLNYNLYRSDSVRLFFYRKESLN